MNSHLLTLLLLLLLTIRQTQCGKGIQTISPDQVLYISFKDYDIKRQTLLKKVGPLLNTSYFSKFQGEIKTQYQGIIYGRGNRALVNMPVRLFNKSCPTLLNIIFKVDPGQPFSSLTIETLQKLYERCPQIEPINQGSQTVIIAGYKIQVQESFPRDQILNILGADFLQQKNVRLEMNYSKYELGNFRLVLQGSQVPRDEGEEF